MMKPAEIISRVMSHPLIRPLPPMVAVEIRDECLKRKNIDLTYVRSILKLHNVVASGNELDSLTAPKLEINPDGVRLSIKPPTDEMRESLLKASTPAAELTEAEKLDRVEKVAGDLTLALSALTPITPEPPVLHTPHLVEALLGILLVERLVYKDGSDIKQHNGFVAETVNSARRLLLKASA